jgi:kinesin family protein 15
MSSLKRPDVLDESYVAADSMKTEFRASFLEIFNDRVYDLLSSADALEIALSVREDARGVFVDGLKEVVVSSAEEAETILRSGIANRHVASTNMNRASSRSHAVFTLNIRSEHTTSDGLQKIRLSKFTLVDLAGSERQKKTGKTTLCSILRLFCNNKALTIVP